MNEPTKNKNKAIVITVISVLLIIIILPSNFNAIGSKKTHFDSNYGNGYDVPRPSLCFEMDDNEECNPNNYIFLINTGDEEKDDADSVELEITVVKGEQYINYIEYDGYIGHIENDQSIPFYFSIHTNSAWDNGQENEIKLEITVINEVYWPDHNIGKQAHYTLVHC